MRATAREIDWHFMTIRERENWRKLDYSYRARNRSKLICDTFGPGNWAESWLS